MLSGVNGLIHNREIHTGKTDIKASGNIVCKRGSPDYIEQARSCQSGNSEREPSGWMYLSPEKAVGRQGQGTMTELTCGQQSGSTISDLYNRMVCLYETFYTERSAVLNSTLSSDRLDSSTAENVPFVVSRQVVAATMDMRSGHAGLVSCVGFLTWNPCNTHHIPSV